MSPAFSKLPFCSIGSLYGCLILICGSATMADEVEFDRVIRPILSNHCFQCHGPDEAQRQADLRLDTSDGAFADLGGYASFVPGKPEDSEAITRVFSDDPDYQMPPPDSKLELSDQQKAALKQWVAGGAKWSEHWSFTAPVMPEIPEDTSGWSRGDIDRLIRAKALQHGLTPMGQASRETLIRRVTMDLTGIPPTPEEIDAFLADQSKDAYENVVDRLLKSPRYGERMAWDWLDAARYADTDGFQGDPTRTMWPWRDWLVDALNENMPYDQFTIEMLAGDLLDSATAEQILATGFNRNHMFNGEGGRIPEETRIENVFDRTETTGTIWLGLTMTCCRCHDHKYDPISQEEYYRLFAFFNNTSEDGRSGRGKTRPVLQYLGPEQRNQRQKLTGAISTLERQLREPNDKLDAEQRKWEADRLKALNEIGGAVTLGPWSQLGCIEHDGKAAYDKDFGPETHVDLKAKVEGLSWASADKLSDGKVYELPTTVGAWYFHRSLNAPSPRKLGISLGSDDAIKVFLNGKQVLANFAARAAAADQEKVDLDLVEGENSIVIKIVNTGGIGGFYFKHAKESVLGLPTEIIGILNADPAKRNATQKDKLRTFYRERNWPKWKELSGQRDAAKKQLDALNKQAVTVMVMDDRKDLRKTVILDRGGYDKPTDREVTVGTPSVLPPMVSELPKNRLGLARWLVSPENPLTARVTVNRHWQMFFGRGLVKSAEDFGSQGTRPTHAKLLDFLAVSLVQGGWNVKALHRQIVTSATYRQTAALSQAAKEKDPENIYWARAPRYRLPSWMLRDQALAVGGLLNETMGGPPVRPYQPEGIWAEATFGKIKYQRDRGDKLYRRSLYIFWRRIVGPTMFFDGAKRQTCEVKPTRTNTPLHALTTLNETTFVESARGLAQRVIQQSDSAEQRLRQAFRMVTSRNPEPPELEILVRRVKSLEKDYAEHTDDALALLKVGESPRDEEIAPEVHAAYTMVCSVLLNLDESLSRQ